MLIENSAHMHQEEPVVCVCSWDIVRPGECYGPVIRDLYIIECCTSGTGSVVVNGKEYPVGPGDCYILLPGDTVIHRASFDNPRRGIWCAVDGAHVGRILAQAGITAESPFVPGEAFEEINKQMENILSMEQEKDPGLGLRQTACIYQILGTLLRYSAGTSKNSCVQKAMSIMEAYYYEQLSVGELAQNVGLERCYFSTLFKEQTGQTPHRYLTGLRIRKACVLMERSDCSIAQVAVSVGLDPQNFARLFKGEIGVSPAVYRKNAGKKKEITDAEVLV